MPDFATIKGTASLGRKMTSAELVRAIRFSVAAEYEAIQVYEQIVEAVEDESIKAVIKDVIEEEKVHAGQFLDVLFRLEPQESKKYDQGARENKEIRAMGNK